MSTTTETPVAFRVTKDEQSVLEALSEQVDDRSGRVFYEHRARTARYGEVIKAEDLSPVIIKLWEEGDEHVRSYLEPLDAEEVDKAAEEFEALVEHVEAVPWPDYDELGAAVIIERIGQEGASGNLDKLIAYEQERNARKTVLKAAQARIQELRAGLTPTGGEE